jgi:hypothetical protein
MKVSLVSWLCIIVTDDGKAIFHWTFGPYDTTLAGWGKASG